MMMGEIRRQYPQGPVDGLAQCSGQLMSIASNNALFSILGDQFGGDGRTTFALPNLPVESGPKYYIALQGIYPRFM